MPIDAAPTRSWWVRGRDGAVILIAVVVLVAGVVSVSRTVVGWIAPASPSAATPVVSDQELAGFAQQAATDFLSWDQGDKVSRQTALKRYAAPGAEIDGWDGTGRQWADTAAVVGIARGEGGRAVVTVRARTLPFVSEPNAPVTEHAPAAQREADANVAAAPQVATQGWTPSPVRWMTLAVPVHISPTGQLVVPTVPALVGSAPDRAERPALARHRSGDDAVAMSSKAAVRRILISFASGDLSYTRASGTHFAGLNGSAGLGELQDWQIAPLQPGTDPTRRRGDATVTWQMTSGAKWTCSYLLDLKEVENRWYLAEISAATEKVNS